jgi:glyoxylase-like metal-dependent hydrolase (beta-lactamase superfamily II)
LLETFPAEFARKHERNFSPSGSLGKLSDHLYVFEDTSNVYILTSGEAALLVGFGSGDVRKKLPGIGVRRIEWVLLTDHHRDQAQGLCDVDPSGFQVAVPEKEAGHFEDVEGFWKNVNIYLNYDCRSHWNTIRRSIFVSRKIKPGDHIRWRGIDLEAIETPGVTEHALSYLAEIDGEKTAFCGSLLSGAGKVPNWFDLHWDYYGFTQGMDASERSFARIQKKDPDRLLPAHGRPIKPVVPALETTAAAYATLREMLVPNELVRTRQEVRQILPHLVFLGANSYAVLSRSGKAFLWDYGYVDRSRVEELKRRYEVSKIDAVSFSHYHDDHIIRAWELAREGTQSWVYENMVDLFENPERYRLPCLVPFPIRVDRILQNDETVRWEEYEFKFFHLPGQTEFHQGLFAVIDGKRILFTGDNTWNKKFPEKRRNGPLVPHNGYFLDGGFIDCARKMLECRPDLVCPAHTEEYSPSRDDLEEFLAWARDLREVMTSLIDQPDPNFGMDYRWCHIYPYRVRPAPQEKARIEVRLRNHLFLQADIKIALKLPPGITCDFPERDIALAGKTQVSVPFDLMKSAAAGKGRQVITADITINGRRIGEYAEAIID